MANYVDEGHQTKKENKMEETLRWLKENNLSHLIPTFNQHQLSIQELTEMDPDSLTEILKAVGLDAISVPRVKSKILKSRNISHSPPQIQRVMITEAETTAIKSLDDKFEELTKEQKTIKVAINELEQEHIQQQHSMNESFKEIISNIEERRKILLNDMNDKVIKYKQKLSKQLKYNANNRNSLTKVKNQYDYNINESAKSSAAANASSNIVRQRSNKNVTMIDEILLNMNELEQKNKRRLQPKHILFEINKLKINDDAKAWGKVVMNEDELDDDMKTQMYDEFDAQFVSDYMKLKGNTVTQVTEKSSSAFLKNVTSESGIYHWKFKVKHCIAKPGTGWYNTIGIWKCKNDTVPPKNTYFTKKKGGYGYAYGYGRKMKVSGDNEGDKYGVKCVTGDVIDMYCDLEKLELRFSVNNVDQGVAMKIEKCKYRAAVNLYSLNDSIELLPN